MPDTLSSESLEWALTHIGRFGDTDFFPVPFEFDAIRHGWDSVRAALSSIDLSNYRPSSTRRFAVPKPHGDFRIASQLDPYDALLYTAMIYEISEEVENARVRTDKDVVFSYRVELNPNGSLFSPTNGWPQFHARSKVLAESGDFDCVISCDITDFYNQASQHRIENALELAGVSLDRAKSVESFLNQLSAKHSRGLPVGPAPSIVLAEACLNDVDMFLLRQRVTHVRYVDDFRIFCEDETQAVWLLHDLCDYLYTAHRLVLNSTKTQIYDVQDFIQHELRDPEEDEELGKQAKLQEMIDSLIREAGGYEAYFNVDDIEDVVDGDAAKQVVRDNLAELFTSAVDSSPLHLGSARHLLRRASTLRTNVIHKITIEHLRILSPVFRDVAGYFQRTQKTTKGKAAELISFLENDGYGQLPFIRMWGLEILSTINGMIDCSDGLEFAERSHSSISGRASAQFAKNGRMIDWIRERKENWSTFGPWDRRALISAASVLSRDERNAWLGLVQDRGDVVDKAVADWAKN